jgi:hypothetical protein
MIPVSTSCTKKKNVQNHIPHCEKQKQKSKMPSFKASDQRPYVRPSETEEIVPIISSNQKNKKKGILAMFSNAGQKKKKR